MTRPICPVCNQRSVAINYIRKDKTYYRSKCDQCTKKKRGIRPIKPRWQSSGYKKKPTCDKCGFRAKYNAQLLVYHVDGNLNNSAERNLRTVCLNCSVELVKMDLTWRKGDLESDI
jgi:hypothetical protein